MAKGFKATVRRTYVLREQRVLVLKSYEGDIEPGQWLEIGLPDGKKAKAQVASLAWGSAFHADSPPLTLVVDGLVDDDPGPDAAIESTSP